MKYSNVQYFDIFEKKEKLDEADDMKSYKTCQAPFTRGV